MRLLRRWYRWLTNPYAIPGQTWHLDGVGKVKIVKGWHLEETHYFNEFGHTRYARIPRVLYVHNHANYSLYASVFYSSAVSETKEPT